MEVTIEGGTDLKFFIKKMHDSLSNARLEVGFLDSKEATIAAKNEYGGIFEVDEEYRERSAKKGVILGTHIGIPPRPFMQTTIKAHSSKWGKTLAEELPEQGYNGKKALGILGSEIVAQIRDTITNGSFIENSDQTEKIKGFNHPLNDTGDMLRAVDFEVR